MVDLREVLTEPAIQPQSELIPQSSAQVHPNPNPSQKCSEPSLYTEINIPLPPLPGSPTASNSLSSTPPKSGPGVRRFSPFHHRRRPSSPTSGTSILPPVNRTRQPEPRIELSMSAVSKGSRKRMGTLDAAIVPAVMVLGAELFTPGRTERERERDRERERERGLMDRLEVQVEEVRYL